ncbi:MAG: hypothetical protein KJ717_08625 [Proteobacteria bacterium]|nr:hypothetical protein [Pseudomonadota bacterium]
MKEFIHSFESNVPEQCKVTFVSSGSKGGDAGHGGFASIIFSENGSDINMQVELTFSNGEKKCLEDLKEIRLTVCAAAPGRSKLTVKK